MGGTGTRHQMSTAKLHAAAPHDLPFFVAGPGQTDVLMVMMGTILVGAVLAAGVFFFWLHSLPERMVHNKIQFDIVAVLVLLSLFTHIHAFWVAALLLAMIDIPKFSLPHFGASLGRIAKSLEKIAARSDDLPRPQATASDGAPTVVKGG